MFLLAINFLYNGQQAHVLYFAVVMPTRTLRLQLHRRCFEVMLNGSSNQWDMLRDTLSITGEPNK